ncbi:cytochrome C biogenesis protein [Hyunsoonleella sp. SJ7]|uniref:Cytochrome C biogenesis protein n=1 Tax=Hyunsoonleella aquatilis TaxID=2762758 RepID=A0A923HD43_9FLAO|nr:protein-disulfide reductase DsbD domain-containing protein [Hyunsoonleella aquatilis]MBC3757903.1 cytochrome C biogenesis protein [Hyunsoonleella aquatilis]
MKIITFLFVLISIQSYSQILNPVTWETSLEKISENEYDIVFTVDIESSWHLYSQYLSEGGPLPTVFKFEPNDNYKCEGQPLEENAKEVYEAVFEMNVKYFENKTVFKQRIIKLNNEPIDIKGTIHYMTCNDEKCIPGSKNFEASIK